MSNALVVMANMLLGVLCPEKNILHPNPEPQTTNPKPQTPKPPTPKASKTGLGA